MDLFLISFQETEQVDLSSHEGFEGFTRQDLMWKNKSVLFYIYYLE